MSGVGGTLMMGFRFATIINVFSNPGISHFIKLLVPSVIILFKSLKEDLLGGRFSVTCLYVCWRDTC